MVRTARSIIVTALWLGLVGAPASANILINGGFDDFGPQATGAAPIDNWSGGSAKCFDGSRSRSGSRTATRGTPCSRVLGGKATICGYDGGKPSP